MLVVKPLLRLGAEAAGDARSPSPSCPSQSRGVCHNHGVVDRGIGALRTELLRSGAVHLRKREAGPLTLRMGDGMRIFLADGGLDPGGWRRLHNRPAGAHKMVRRYASAAAAAAARLQPVASCET